MQSSSQHVLFGFQTLLFFLFNRLGPGSTLFLSQFRIFSSSWITEARHSKAFKGGSARGAVLERHYQALRAGKQHDGCIGFGFDLSCFTLVLTISNFLPSHPSLRLLTREGRSMMDLPAWHEFVCVSQSAQYY